MPLERLHKVLAQAGVASRRDCEEIIAEGHVTVDGEIVTAMGVMVDADVQEIRYNGERIRREAPVHYLVYKPKGYLCTSKDEYGRPTVISLIKDRKKRRLYTVGRLDADSEGLIIVTNDGEFANKMAHPRYGIDKTYNLKLHGYLGGEALKKAREGVWLSEGKTQSMYVRANKRSKHHSTVTVMVREGKNRQLRRIFARLGHAVAELTRVRIGGIATSGLKRGHYRKLTPEEVAGLEERVQGFRAEDKQRGSDRRAKRSGPKRRPGGPPPGRRSGGRPSGGQRGAGRRRSRR